MGKLLRWKRGLGLKYRRKCLQIFKSSNPFIKFQSHHHCCTVKRAVYTNYKSDAAAAGPSQDQMARHLAEWISLFHLHSPGCQRRHQSCGHVLTGETEKVWLRADGSLSQSAGLLWSETLWLMELVSQRACHPSLARGFIFSKHDA